MSVSLKQIGFEAEALVEKVLDEIPTFYSNVEGIAKRPEGARYELTLLPPSGTLENKRDFLIYEAENLVGFIDVYLGYPNAETAFLGLLALREPFQRRSLGKKSFFALEEYLLTHTSMQTIRIGVNDTNPVEGYWTKMGFSHTGEIKTYEGVAKRSSLVVLEKRIRHDHVR